MEPTGVEGAQQTVVDTELPHLKEAQWDQKRAELMQDNAQHVDAGIVDTVVGLNMLGIHTTHSSEGHSHINTLAPWVDIEPKEIDKALEPRVYAAWNEANESSKDNLPIEERKQLFEEAHRLTGEFNTANRLEAQKLIPYLEGFYKGRDVPFAQRLIIQQMSATSRLTNQGSVTQVATNEEERNRDLAQYRSEMNAFSLFLKQKFMQSPTPQPIAA